MATKKLTPKKKSEVDTREASMESDGTYKARYSIPEVVVTGKKKKKPYWVTANTKQLQPSELMAPFSIVGEAIDMVPGGHYVNEYIFPALSLGNYVAALHEGSINPYKGAELRANDEALLGAYLPLDFAGPKIFGKVSQKATTPIKTAVESGTFYDKYTTLSGRLGYYGTPTQRVYGTIARRLNLPDKARSPELIRKLDKDLTRLPNGNYRVSAPARRDFQRTNFTIDRPVVSHEAGNWDHMDTYIFDPKIIDWNKAASIEPSDVFFPNYPNITANPNQVTLISGNINKLQTARSQGISTLSSQRLRDLYQQMVNTSKTNPVVIKGMRLDKQGLSNAPAQIKLNYAKEIQRLQSSRGVPKYKDFIWLEDQTGLSAGITKNNLIKQLQDKYNKALQFDVPLSQMTPELYSEIYGFTFPNGNYVEGLPQLKQQVKNITRTPYNNVQYMPASFVESNWRKINQSKSAEEIKLQQLLDKFSKYINK